jgi:putative tricarboxylic transport membrane protein
MNRLDLLSGFFWLAISIIVCIESIRAGFGNLKDPGPGFLPLCVGVILGAFAIILLIKSSKDKRVKVTKVNPFRKIRLSKVILFLASLFAYTTLLVSLGYLITTLVLMVSLFVVMERSGLWIEIIIAPIVVLISYVVFYKWLGIQLPRGIFGF